MKCQLTLKTVRSSLLVCLLLGGVASSSIYGIEAIESIFSKAKTMLSKRNPASLSKLKNFEDKMYAQLRSFLDMNNKESYEVHVNRMEQTVNSFQAEFVLHKDFGCIKNLTHVFHEELQKLLVLLKTYIGTRSATVLGLALVNFEHLLPKVIIKEVGGVRGLQARLTHRLSC